MYSKIIKLGHNEDFFFGKEKVQKFCQLKFICKGCFIITVILRKFEPSVISRNSGQKGNSCMLKVL